MHTRIKTARTLVTTAKATVAIDNMFNGVYELCCELEQLGVFGLTEVVDKAVHDMKAEIAVIDTAARTEASGIPPISPAPHPSAPAAAAG